MSGKASMLIFLEFAAEHLDKWLRYVEDGPRVRFYRCCFCFQTVCKDLGHPADTAIRFKDLGFKPKDMLAFAEWLYHQSHQRDDKLKGRLPAINPMHVPAEAFFIPKPRQALLVNDETELLKSEVEKLERELQHLETEVQANVRKQAAMKQEICVAKPELIARRLKVESMEADIKIHTSIQQKIRECQALFNVLQAQKTTPTKIEAETDDEGPQPKLEPRSASNSRQRTTA